MQIPDLIRQLSGNNNHNDNSIYEAEVIDLDIPNRNAIVRTISGPDISEMPVRLMTTIGDGFLIIPKIGSNVVIMVNPLINPFIIQYGETQDVLISSSQTIILNSDEYNGLVKVQELTDKINVLENALNNLINLFNAHIHGVTGANTIAIVAPFIDTDIIQVTEMSELENQDIKHGSRAE